MKKLHKSKPMTHKTDYAPRYILTEYGFVYEYIGLLSDNKLVVRVPGHLRCFLFDSNNLVFCPSRGEEVFFSSDGIYYAATVLDYFLSFDRELFYKIRVYDSRWNNPLRVLSIPVDDLDF